MRLLASASLLAFAASTLLACGSSDIGVSGDPARTVDAGGSTANDDAGVTGGFSGDDASTVDAGPQETTTAPNYVPSDATTYAAAHWDDGVGLCAEFVSHCVRAGHLDMDVLTWVPDVLAAFTKMGIPFEEHGDTGAANAQPGDVVIFSNKTGAAFCATHDTDEGNCGHTCLVTVGGDDVDTIKVDCHNNAHHEEVLSTFFGGMYSKFRVYHLVGGEPLPGSGGSDAGPACSTDTDCNGGKGETGLVCGNAGVCIQGCHVDHDCPGKLVCDESTTPWSCD